MNYIHKEILNFINDNQDSFAIIVFIIDNAGKVKVASSIDKNDMRSGNMPEILRELASQLEGENLNN